MQTLASLALMLYLATAGAGHAELGVAVKRAFLSLATAKAQALA